MGTPVTVEGWVSDPVDVHFSEPLPPTPNRDGWTAQTVTIPSAGDAIQGPDVEIPDGFGLAIVFRNTQAGAPTGFMANSAANVGDSVNRTELLKGDRRILYVSNMNEVFFGSDTDGAVFELIVEQ